MCFKRYRFLCFCLIVGLVGIMFSPCLRAQEQPWSEIALTPNDRILILAPHPDDEVIGCAGIIQKALALKLPIRIAFFTYGDNNQWSFLVYRKHPVLMPRAVEVMGIKRHDEAFAASKILGLQREDLIFLGYPDFGTMNIWYDHWGKRPPFRSMLTRVQAVPYPSAFRPGAPYKGEEVLADLKNILNSFKPTKVFVSHPADHNGDHRSLYLFLRVALWDLEDFIKPKIYPYLVHCVKWPLKERRLNQVLEPPQILKSEIPWEICSLTPDEIIKKLKAIKAHKSQYQSSEKYLRLFIRSNELFGDFPEVKLEGGDMHASLSTENGGRVVEAPEELTEIERASFIGLEWRFVRIEDHKLVISIKMARPFAEGVIASIYVFGYRSDRPFKDMPKLHVRLGVTNYTVYDQAQRLPKQTIEVIRSLREITIRVPLEKIGNPGKILTSAQTYLSDIPLDWVSWRILELPKDFPR